MFERKTMTTNCKISNSFDYNYYRSICSAPSSRPCLCSDKSYSQAQAFQYLDLYGTCYGVGLSGTPTLSFLDGNETLGVVINYRGYARDNITRALQIKILCDQSVTIPKFSRESETVNGTRYTITFSGSSKYACSEDSIIATPDPLPHQIRYESTTVAGFNPYIDGADAVTSILSFPKSVVVHPTTSEIFIAGKFSHSVQTN